MQKIQIMLNGAAFQVEPDTSIQQLLTQLDLAQKRIAVELNESIIPRSRHQATLLNKNDQIEIVHAIGGG